MPPEAERAAEIQPARLARKAGGAVPQEATAAPHDLARELAELRKQIETVKRSVDRRPATISHTGGLLSAVTAEVVARLTGADFSQDLAMDLAAAVENRLAREGADASPDAALRAEWQERLHFSPTLAGSSELAPRGVVRRPGRLG